MTSLADLHASLRDFAERRDWQRFHNAKNLTMALAGEAGEVAALLQWVAPEDVPTWLGDEHNAAAMRHEIADVFAYLLYLSDSVNVDPVAALAEKMQLNEARYPVDLSRGNPDKYDRLHEGDK